MKHFYSHLVDIQTLTIELDKMDLEDHHKKELATMIDAMIHHTVMDIVMSHLDQQDHHQFVHKLKNDDPEEVMKFVKSRVDTIEDEIHLGLEELKKELHSDINESHRMIGKTKK